LGIEFCSSLVAFLFEVF